jgi:hypothetical protein
MTNWTSNRSVQLALHRCHHAEITDGKAALLDQVAVAWTPSEVVEPVQRIHDVFKMPVLSARKTIGDTEVFDHKKSVIFVLLLIIILFEIPRVFELEYVLDACLLDDTNIKMQLVSIPPGVS